MRLPLRFNSTNPILKYIILFLYIIGSPKIVTKEYRFSFCLCGSLNYLIIFNDIWFLITLLLTIALNFIFWHLVYRLKCYPMTPLRV